MPWNPALIDDAQAEALRRAVELRRLRKFYVFDLERVTPVGVRYESPIYEIGTYSRWLSRANASACADIDHWH